MVIGPVEHRTNFRFRNFDDFETYRNARDLDYDSGDVTYTSYIHELNTPQFETVKRSAYAKSTNCMREIVGYHGQNCFIPTSRNCSIENLSFLTEKNYQEEFQDIIRKEKY